MEGGERGIKARTDDAVNKLSILAKSDFKHDFGEGVESRDKFVDTDLVRFQEIAQRYGIGNVKALKEGFTRLVGSNPYAILKASIPDQIYPVPGFDTDYRDESAVMNLIGLDYDGRPNGLKERLKRLRTQAERTPGVSMADTVFRPYATDADSDNPLIIQAPGGIARSYEVTAVLVKDKGGEGTLNIASRFQNVTGGKTKFAMVIDASGGLSMTSVQNSDLNPLPTAKCDFYILENIENDSDSATKLKHIDVPKDPDRLALKPDLHILKDDVNTVVYPSFNVFEGKHDAEALFGNANLVLSRTEDDTEADFTFGDGSTYHIENVSQNANVKNASLNILAARLADPDSKQPYLYPYIKRVGDWCQALSLLDTSRPYRPVGEDKPDGDETFKGGADPITLESLRKDGAVVAALTLDRILLAYLLSLGLDVFFTTATDLRMLIYFRNMETEMKEEELAAAVEKYEAEYKTIEKQLPFGDKVPSVLDASIQAVRSQTTDITYIAALRSVLYRISVLRTSYPDLIARLTEQNAKIKAAKEARNAKEQQRLLFDGILIAKKILNDHKHNETQLSSLATYPNFVNDKQVYELMAGDRPSRNAIAKLKVIISKDMHNDVIQCKKIFTTYAKDISLMFRTEPIEPAKFGEIWTAFGPEFRVQTGGGEAEINEALLGLRQFEITPVTEAVYDAAAERPELPLPVDDEDEEDETPAKDLPTLAVVGSYYRDEKGFPYSVLDKYLVTKETLPLFEIVFKHVSEPGGGGIEPFDMFFVMKRYLLLWCDLLQAAYEKLLMNDDDEVNEETKAITESDVKFSEHKRLYYQAEWLLRLVTTQGMAADVRFSEAYNQRGFITLVDNDTLDAAYRAERLGLRKNDYKRTRDKIQTLRTAITRLAFRRPPVVLPRAPVVLPRAPVLPNPYAMDERAGGGLQTRRGLYPNHAGGAADSLPRDRPGLYARLRKRARPRRTARVRQRTNRSRTRRQRDTVDRL